MVEIQLLGLRAMPDPWSSLGLICGPMLTLMGRSQVYMGILKPPLDGLLFQIVAVSND